MSALDQAQGLLQCFRIAFEAEDKDKSTELLTQLKLQVFTGQSAGDSNERILARDTLELACFLSVLKKDMQGFERHVAQLKMYYTEGEQSEHKHTIFGLYLLHLLAADRIGEFHTELELITLDDHENTYIKTPIQLERHLMEGNYAKILATPKDFPQKYYDVFHTRLMETVRHKVGASLERSYENLPVDQAAKMLMLEGVAELSEFAVKENERKAREEQDDTMGDMTPSLSRRNLPQAAHVRWEVKSGRLHFTRSAEKRMEIPAADLMINTIGYATDLERIV